MQQLAKTSVTNRFDDIDIMKDNLRFSYATGKRIREKQQKLDESVNESIYQKTKNDVENNKKIVGVYDKIRRNNDAIIDKGLKSQEELIRSKLE